MLKYLLLLKYVCKLNIKENNKKNENIMKIDR